MLLKTILPLLSLAIAVTAIPQSLDDNEPQIAFDPLCPTGSICCDAIKAPKAAKTQMEAAGFTNVDEITSPGLVGLNCKDWIPQSMNLEDVDGKEDPNKVPERWYVSRVTFCVWGFGVELDGIGFH
ncbi:hypothetical protein D9756_010570 [Leucocoprinus leucothites]|uniref:Hydrophobin n=1 Tax=Leucocoprinus leucothites TaxID=201217 RepID=A0A8H5FS97_9AGAR|nr:hypothetical protein D9756_010570 [Leucoagaricus leucothites]